MPLHLRPARARLAIACVATLVLGLNLVMAGTATGNDSQRGQIFTGVDGLLYMPAETVVHGKDGVLYIGEDFDALCGVGRGFTTGLHRLARLSQLIERSGRRSLFALAPDKSSVVLSDLPDPLPHGSCDQFGLERDRKVLDGYGDPDFVLVRRRLARTPDAFWKTDAHWSTVGGSVYAEEVARHLSRRLARAQRYVTTQRTKLGDLEIFLPDAVAETAPARLPANGVSTRPADGSPAFDSTFIKFYMDLSWTSTPARKTWPGRTLLLGDSFTYTALEPLMNLFHNGRFMWLGHTDTDDIVRAISRADTVIIEAVQRFASTTPAVTRSFYAAVRRGLRQSG
jgi:hypothetical protein